MNKPRKSLLPRFSRNSSIQQLDRYYDKDIEKTVKEEVVFEIKASIPIFVLVAINTLEVVALKKEGK
jgi:hypothetical protein